MFDTQPIADLMDYAIAALEAIKHPSYNDKAFIKFAKSEWRTHPQHAVLTFEQFKYKYGAELIEAWEIISQDTKMYSLNCKL
jgi:hypothetical protein